MGFLLLFHVPKSHFCPKIFEKIKVSIRTQPSDSSGHQDFSLLKKNIINLGLNDLFYLGPPVPQGLLEGYVESLDILILPYKDSSMLSASGPVAYGITYDVPVIGSGYLAKSSKYVYPFNVNSATSLANAILDVVTLSEKWRMHIDIAASVSAEVNWKSTCNKILNAELLCI